MTDLKLNIYLNGVGGQGIGLLSELLMRAYSHAGYHIMGADTHGLAQRGGVVESHLRVGYAKGNPMVETGKADLVFSLERTEAYRALGKQARAGGTVIFYDTLWQPLSDRMGETRPVTLDILREFAASKKVRLYRVYEELPDARMQNTALLGAAFHLGLLHGLRMDHLQMAMGDLAGGKTLEANIEVVARARGTVV